MIQEQVYEIKIHYVDKTSNKGKKHKFFIIALNIEQAITLAIQLATEEFNALTCSVESCKLKGQVWREETKK